MKEILMSMVEAAVKAKGLSDTMECLGYPENPYWDLYTLIADAIYTTVGEKTNTFDESVTFMVLNDPDLTNDERVSRLLSA